MSKKALRYYPTSRRTSRHALVVWGGPSFLAGPFPFFVTPPHIVGGGCVCRVPVRVWCTPGRLASFAKDKHRVQLYSTSLGSKQRRRYTDKRHTLRTDRSARAVACPRNGPSQSRVPCQPPSDPGQNEHFNQRRQARALHLDEDVAKQPTIFLCTHTPRN
jgi:hypothetical protein